MPSVQSLIPHTGVQYIELPALFTEEDLVQSIKAAPAFMVKPQVVPRLKAAATGPIGLTGWAASPDAEVDLSSNFDLGLGATAPAQPAEVQAIRMPADLRAALEIASADAGWLPIPFNSTSALWSMIWLGQRTAGVWDAVLAIDTTLSPHGDGGTLPESSVPGDFKLEPRLGVFWGTAQVMDWVESHFKRLNPGKGMASVSEPKKWRGAIQANLVGLFTFLAQRPKFPVLQFESASQSEPIKVSVVVDLGNSRTCCVLHEMRAPLNRKPFRALELRDPLSPLDVSSDPAPTRLVFVSPARSILPGAKTFMDLSVIRYGSMAVNMLGASGGDVGARGLSSPKRYMWDNEKRSEAWQLARPDPTRTRQTIHGALLRRMDENLPFSEPDLTQNEPVNPSYPRKAGTLFLLIEILEQAYRQMNSADHRGVEAQQPGYRNRRVIQTIVLMHPAGMHSEEVEEFRRAAKRAVELWSEFRRNPQAFADGEPEKLPGESGIPTPQVIQNCDEGMSIQICWLYGETMYRYQERADRLLAAMGRKRGGQPSVRVASIDIGGGTADLAIAEYVLPERSIQPTYHYRRLFHDGFPVGGDDLGRELLRELVFPKIIEAAKLTIPEWNALFSATLATDTAWADARRKLVDRFWVPLVHGCLRRIEVGGTAEGTIRDLLTVRNDAIAVTFDHRVAQVIAGRKRSFNSSTSDQPADKPLGVLDVKLTITQDDLLRVARRTFGPALRQYADIIGQYRADVLVLGGRPAALPAIDKLIQQSLPVPPGAVVFLHQQSVDDWFPFHENGRIGDSKTCSVVGAALAYMAQNDYSNFVLYEHSDDQKVISIPGVFSEKMKVFNSQIDLFPDSATESTMVRFEGLNLMLGARHVDGASAIARPTYRLRRDPRLDDLLERRAIGNQPLDVRLSRDDVGSDRLKVKSVEGAIQFFTDTGEKRELRDDVRMIQCKLQTMVEQDYWLDSGCFRELIDNA